MPFTHSVWGFSHIYPHRAVGSVLIHSIRVCVWLGASFLSCLAFCNICLNERLVVIDANCFILSPEQIIPSTLCPRLAKVKLPRVPLAAAEIAYLN